MQIGKDKLPTKILSPLVSEYEEHTTITWSTNSTHSNALAASKTFFDSLLSRDYLSLLEYEDEFNGCLRHRQ